ncbi:MAG TPA: SemiSWEET family transporter [Acidimicrobiales bacterium]|nr:SemiSWEET family transporter [Acidimicrobiales bacterium]
MLEQVVTALAVVLALTHPVPQIVRVVRTRSVAGVSGPTTWIGLVVNVAWVSYGVARGLVPVAVLSGAYVAGYVVVATLLVRRGNRRGVGVALLAAAAMAGLTAAGGWAVLGTVLALAVLPQYLPQVVEAWTADDLTGLSPGTYVVGVLDGVVWGGFGLVVADRPLVLYGVVMVSVATAVLAGRARWAAGQPTGAVELGPAAG